MEQAEFERGTVDPGKAANPGRNLCLMMAGMTDKMNLNAPYKPKSPARR